MKKEEDKATVLEYLSNVQEMIKEYLNKPANRHEHQITLNPVPPVILRNLQVTMNLVQAARRMIPSNTLQMIGVRTTTIQNGKEDWSGGFTDLGSYLRSTRKILTNIRYAGIKRKCGMGLRLLSLTK